MGERTMMKKWRVAARFIARPQWPGEWPVTSIHEPRAFFRRPGRLTAPARSFSLASLILIVSIVPGCATMPLFGQKTAKFDRADAKNPAVEILSLWQATEGPGPNGVPTRGFSGQIFFFTQAKPSPVVVDGKVRIYLFDDHGTVKQQARPIGEFDFDPANWNGHAHASTLGPGYAVFIPYPRNDFHQATCSLRVRFTPNVGPTIYSPTASVVLSGPPGKPPRSDEMMVPPLQPRQQAMQNANPAGAAAAVAPVSARAPLTRNVVPVSGTEADARLSLEDDIAAPTSENAATPRSGRLTLQSANAQTADSAED